MPRWPPVIPALPTDRIPNTNPVITRRGVTGGCPWPARPDRGRPTEGVPPCSALADGLHLRMPSPDLPSPIRIDLRSMGAHR